MRIVALIPARAGSKRIPGKNLKPLGGKPLIQWTIEAARQAELFEAVMVSTEDDATAEIAWKAGAMVDHRPPEMAEDHSPDIQWVQHSLESLRIYQITPDSIAILRPTSPFRTAATMHRAWDQFRNAPVSSLRAVEPVTQHPGKMWQIDYGEMHPLIAGTWPCKEGYAGLQSRTPWHSLPTQTLPKVYVQNASLEIARTWCITVFGNISGPKVMPFFTDGWEGFDINTPEDWERAERHAASLLARV